VSRTVGDLDPDAEVSYSSSSGGNSSVVHLDAGCYQLRKQSVKTIFEGVPARKLFDDWRVCDRCDPTVSIETEDQTVGIQAELKRPDVGIEDIPAILDGATEPQRGGGD